MDHSNTNNDEFAVDIESATSDREDGGSVNVEDQASLCGSSVNSDVDSVESVVIDMKLEDMNLPERKLVKEKCKKMSNKNAPKPPRPPRGPSLDAADQKLMREIAELTMLKRIRTERVKALKKMKAAKPSSSSSNSLFAMIFTIIFCLVILRHGITTRSTSHPIFDGYPPSSSSLEPDLISIQYVRDASGIDYKMAASRSPSLMELVSGQEPRERAKSVSV